MVRSTNLLVLAAGAACLAAGSSASANERPTHPRVLVAQFGVAADTSGLEGASRPELISQLEREFSDLGGGDASGSSNGMAPPPPSFLRIPRARVPAWMRTGLTTSTSPNLTSGLTLSGECAARPYLPSNLLGRSAEERRRILYPLVRNAACEAGLPVGLMDAMLIQESRYNPLAISPKGAFGLGQLMPGTAVQLGVDRYDLRGNLAGAARYLRQHIDEFRQVPLALAAYNAGPGRVRKGWSIPRITETQNYVRQILVNWRTLEWGAAPPVRPQSSAITRQSLLVSSFP